MAVLTGIAWLVIKHTAVAFVFAVSWVMGWMARVTYNKWVNGELW